MSTYLTRAIILRSYNSKENDKVIHALTLDNGVVSFVVKGIRKISHKFKSNLEIFSVQEIELYKKNKNAMYVLTYAKIIDAHYNLREDFIKFSAVCLLVDVVDSVIPEDGHDDGKAFHLLEETLTFLEKENKTLSILSWSLLHLLEITGHSPVMDVCTKCGCKIKKDNIACFSLDGGGMLCKQCSQKYSINKFPITYNSYLVIKGLLSEQNYENIREKCDVLKPDREKDVLRIVLKLVEYFFDKKMKINIESLTQN